tara:strand:- start:1306 stop:1665 length:360 start_codon:yes stop_codon:yes gene_type:complete
MSLSEAINEIQTLLDQTKAEIKILESGRKASAPRARKHAQSIKNLAHNLRKNITSHVSTIPVKTRTRKENVEVAEPIVEVAEPIAEVNEPEPMLEPLVKSVLTSLKTRKKRVAKSLSDK